VALMPLSRKLTQIGEKPAPTAFLALTSLRIALNFVNSVK
jgi:hypothetical protein